MRVLRWWITFVGALLLLNAAAFAADTSVPNMPTVSSVAGTDIFYDSQGGTSSRATGTQVATFVNSLLLGSNNTWTGTNAFGAASFSSTITATGLSAGTQVSCIGLDASNHFVLNAAACGSSVGGSGTVTTLTAGTNVTFSSGATCTTTCTINASGGTGTPGGTSGQIQNNNGSGGFGAYTSPGAVDINSSGLPVPIGTGQGIEPGPGVYNVLVASAANTSPMKNDGVSVCAGTVTISGGNTVTISGSPQLCGSNAVAWAGFASGDVGKDIILPSAGSVANVPCVITVGTFTSSTAIGYSSTKQGCTNGAYTLSAFTGVVMTYGTDNTTAWNTLVGNLVGTTWNTQQGGTIYFPAGIYVMDGTPAALPGAGGIKAVMVIPDRDTGSLVSPPFQLTLVGQDKPKAGYTVVSNAQKISESGTILISGRGDTTGFSIFLGGSSTLGFSNFDNITLYAKDLTFRTYNNPQLGGPWASLLQGAYFENVTVDVGTGVGPANITPNTLVPGIVMPKTLNGTVSYANNTVVIGYQNCYIASEHFTAPYIEAYFCGVSGLQVDATDHSIWIGRALFQYAPSFVQSALGPSQIQIDELDTEYATAGSYATTVFVKDASNFISGYIGFGNVLGGTGIQANTIITGGTGLVFHDIAANYNLISRPNAGTTGTTQFTLTKLTASGAVKAATTDTNGMLGVAAESAGTTGTALIATSGVVKCVFDGATTNGDWVQISSTTAGDCHDTGSTSYPSSGQVIGQVQSTNVGAGTYSVSLSISTAPGGAGSGINQLTGDVTAGPGSGSQPATIANSAVTLAKIANASANSVLLGSGATGSGSAYSQIILGTNLSMSGTTLNATGGGTSCADTGFTVTNGACFKTLTPSGSPADIEFTGLVGKNYQINCSAVTGTTTDHVAFEVNDGSWVTGAVYADQGQFVINGSPGAITGSTSGMLQTAVQSGQTTLFNAMFQGFQTTSIGYTGYFGQVGSGGSTVAAYVAASFTAGATVTGIRLRDVGGTNGLTGGSCTIQALN